MLGDQDAVAVDQLLCAFLLQSLIVPRTGEGHVHGDGGADGLSAQIEGGVTGNHLSVGESADIAHLGLISGDLTGLDHLVQLHTGSDTGQITTLIDGGESVVIVGDTGGVSQRAGGVAELNIGALLSSLQHEGLMAEGVGEDDVAAVIDQVHSGVVALLALGDVGLQDVVSLGQTQVGNSFHSTIDKVLVIGGVLIMQADETNLDSGSSTVISSAVISGRCVVTAGHQRQSHDQSQDQSKKLLHYLFSSLIKFHTRHREFTVRMNTGSTRNSHCFLERDYYTPIAYRFQQKFIKPEKSSRFFAVAPSVQGNAY